MNAIGTSGIVVDVPNRRAWWKSIGGEPEEWAHVYENMKLLQQDFLPGIDAYSLYSNDNYNCIAFAASNLKEYIGQDDSWGDRCDFTAHQQELLENYLQENGYTFIAGRANE